MKKILTVIGLLIVSVLLVSCQTEEPDPDPDPTVTYTVAFDSDGGSAVASQTINENETATEPDDPILEGYTFQFWSLDGENAYDFSTAVTADITLTASWLINVASPEEMIAEDIAALEENFQLNPYQLNFVRRGTVNNSRVYWDEDSDYISESGYILPLNMTETTSITTTVTGEFVIDDVSIEHEFEVVISPMQPVEIESSREVAFENLTTEYHVDDSSLMLYFEEDGYVPYVKVVDFFALLENGFIDPDTTITYTKGDGTLEISYQYYDEDFDELYDLICTIDANTNTITTNDPGFYWAYVYSTETNYGRHIEYDSTNPDAYYTEGHDIVFNLSEYNLDMTVYEGDVVLPYYVVNQLFAGSSYYNVYYNYDGLYGIYSLPSEGTTEYRTIKGSSMNEESIPGDLVAHTFNTMAFDLDHFYGLKDIMEVDSYYGLLMDNLDDILTGDAEDMDVAIAEFLLKKIDEPHTSYGYPSYFNQRSWDGPSVSSLSDYGPRFQSWYYAGLIDTDEVIEAKWGRVGITSTQWAAYSESRPVYWFLDDTTLMIALDDFYTADIEESATYDSAIANSMLEADDISLVLPEIAVGNKFFYYNNSDDDQNLLEIIVKGTSLSDLDDFMADLATLGYVEVSDAEDTNEDKSPYAKLTIGDVTYMVQCTYDLTYNLLYVGISNDAPESYSDNWPFYINVPDLVQSDSAVFMEMNLEQAFIDNPNIEDIVLDLSWNTGGNVGALYRIVGFITDQPFAVSGISPDTDSESTYYVVIDGVPNYSAYNWALVITPTTFSAANEMATIFKENALGPIIGVQSGGGAASITPILLPNGTAFTMSSTNLNAIRTGSGTEEDPYVYYDNEFGIAPDYPIDISQIFNPDVLLPLIADYYS